MRGSGGGVRGVECLGGGGRTAPARSGLCEMLVRWKALQAWLARPKVWPGSPATCGPDPGAADGMPCWPFARALSSPHPPARSHGNAGGSGEKRWNAGGSGEKRWKGGDSGEKRWKGGDSGERRWKGGDSGERRRERRRQVIFTIAGNKYRLVVWITYPYQVVYVRVRQAEICW